MAPFLLGEIGVRTYLHRVRSGVPVAATAVVNIWERLIDVAALATIAVLTVAPSSPGQTQWMFAGGAALATLVPAVRRRLLEFVVSVASRAARLVGRAPVDVPIRLAAGRTCLVAFATSLGAWLLPGLGLWLLTSGLLLDITAAEAQHAYAASSLAGALTLAPGGVLVTGRHLLDELERAGLGGENVVLAVFGIRLATAGVSTALGIVLLLVHWRSARASASAHFDVIAGAYDAQIPEGRRDALLSRKTELMRGILERAGTGRLGLDVGCGHGRYVGRMRELGFDVRGLDDSAGQVAQARLNLQCAELVTTGSILEIPASDGAYDFAYTINVLHHLPSVEDQRAAFRELARVVRPGGLIFVHEINTRNILFRFYMGYVFPSLNCIDEGVERWLRPDRLDGYTALPIAGTTYFTFLPEFVPEPVVRLCRGVEAWLESSRLRVYSAHYMAVLRKPSP
jgi:SAM-dependent methyltransferase